jgi:hypothetical protein
MSAPGEGREDPRAAPAWPDDSSGSAPHTQEASNFLKMLALVDDVMFSVLLVADDGACTCLYVSPGVTPLLGFTVEEYMALGCAHHCCRFRERATHAR